MTVSNEPGYYEEGAFGIRVENICITVPASDLAFADDSNKKKFCTFETVTLVPIQRKLIQMSLITDDELTWLNNYHEKVRAELMPIIMEKFPDATGYLLRETEIITRE